MEFESRVCGIPCIIKVNTFHIQKGSFDYNETNDWDYYGYEDIEFEVLDRKGYRAKWLERKMKERDIDKVQQEIKEAYESANEPDWDDYI
ncbi:MAG: hypothetical protein PHC28_16345 [Flavobacterium sp.]|uniref:hypothetical protein n=1 Tax=Flavobacterium sp. TaxID=239 RepID=UPI00260F67DB|nr:hypothetical protein [Flavobacterium sp.]MDD5152024.1 hypothetical protein [Flavobacterium sp.]